MRNSRKLTYLLICAILGTVMGYFGVPQGTPSCLDVVLDPLKV
jgi:hypothetical protein